MVRAGSSRSSGGPAAVTLPVYGPRSTLARTAVLPVPPLRVLPPWFIRPRAGSLEAWTFLLSARCPADRTTSPNHAPRAQPPHRPPAPHPPPPHTHHPP